jgi:hypothetical protein
MNDLYDFIQRSDESKSVEKLTASLSRFLGAFGMGGFSMAKLSHRPVTEREREFGLMVNYPQEWLTRYYDKSPLRFLRLEGRHV